MTGIIHKNALDYAIFRREKLKKIWKRAPPPLLARQPENETTRTNAPPHMI